MKQETEERDKVKSDKRHCLLFEYLCLCQINLMSN
jgi:hypothetical protein